MKGPSPGYLDAFRFRVEKEKEVSRMQFYQLLADEAGMSVKGVRRYFSNPKSNDFSSCPYSLWRLWHLVLFNQDIKKEGTSPGSVLISGPTGVGKSIAKIAKTAIDAAQKFEKDMDNLRK